MPRVDIHVHLAGLTGDPHGCFVSERMRRSLTYWLLKQLNGLDDRDPGLGSLSFANRLISLMESANEVDYACVFAMDGVYDGGGELVPAESHLYVPNAYVFAVCARSPKLLPVISINPQRADALEELARWGPDAVAIKWLGPLQKFDATDPRYDRFYDLLRELQLPVIAHSGCEHTFPGMAQRLGDPLLYEGVVQRGMPVIFSHCGTGTFLHPGHDYTPQFVQLLERYDNVYGDTSGFCTLVRYKQVRRFAADRYIGRILHGSDFPVPSFATPFLRALGFDGSRHVLTERHPFDRDVITKRRVGMPDSCFTAAGELLAGRIQHWESVRTRYRANA